MTRYLRALALGCGIVAAACGAWAQAPRPKGVLVVPMGNASVAAIEELCRSYAARWRISVERSFPAALDESLADTRREQVVAERALQWLETRFAREAADHVVIGVMGADMYIAAEKWRFAFSLRQHRPGAPALPSSRPPGWTKRSTGSHRTPRDSRSVSARC